MLQNSGIFFLHHLIAPVQQTRWEQYWTQAGYLEFAEPKSRDLERYIWALSWDHIILRDREDVLVWDSAPNGKDTPKAGYIKLSGQGVDRDVVWWWKSLWKINFPPKTKLFMWCVLENKAPSWDNLQKRCFHGPG